MDQGEEISLNDLPDDVLGDIANHLDVDSLLNFLSALAPRVVSGSRRTIQLSQDTEVASFSLRLRANRSSIRDVDKLCVNNERECGRDLVTHNSPLIKALVFFEGLRELDLSGLELGTLGLGTLERSPVLANLRSLNVDRCTYIGAVTSPGSLDLKRPAFASTLRKLSIRDGSLARRWKLSWFTALESFTGKLMDPSVIIELAQWDKLRELHLQSTRICPLRAEGPEWRALLRRLRVLTFTGCELLPRPHLQQQPWAVMVDIVERAPDLAELHLIDTVHPEITDEILERVLERLEGRVLRATGKWGDRHATSLRTDGWDAYHQGYVDPDAPLVQSSESPFTSLTITPSAHLTDRSMGVIGQTVGPTLRKLTLGPCSGLGDGGLVVLAASCPLLSSLDIPCAPNVSGFGVAALAHSPAAAAGRLVRLNIAGCTGVSGSSLLELAASTRSSLRHVNLRGCHGALQSEDGRSALQQFVSAGCRVAYDPPVVRAAIDDAGDSVLIVSASLSAPASGFEQGEAVECPYGCASRVRMIDLQDHWHMCQRVTVHCVNRLDGCAFVAPRADASALRTHMATCPAWRICCTVCFETIPRSGYTSHMEAHWSRDDNRAMAVAQRCPMAEDGCPFAAASRCEWDAHLAAGACRVADYSCTACGATAGETGQRLSVRGQLCGSADCAKLSRRHFQLARQALSPWSEVAQAGRSPRDEVHEDSMSEAERIELLQVTNTVTRAEAESGHDSAALEHSHAHTDASVTRSPTGLLAGPGTGLSVPTLAARPDSGISLLPAMHIRDWPDDGDELEGCVSVTRMSPCWWCCSYRRPRSKASVVRQDL